MTDGTTPRRAWVMGASRGLGNAVARRLLQQGLAVTASARPGERLDAAVEALSALGAVDALPMDLSEPRAVTRALEELVGRHGSVPDVVIFNGGGPPPGPVARLGVEGLDGAYASMLRPAYELVAGIDGPMRERGSGVVVFLTSSGVLEPIPNLVASNAMRSAITALAKTAAAELAGDGVRVLCVAPGRIATDRVGELDDAAAKRQHTTVDDVAARSRASIPAGRYGTPEEFSAVVGFLCSPDASYMTGTTVLVDGGKIGGLLS
jgi:3-oxoacyl-[acyl-carrier protein] reductase